MVKSSTLVILLLFASFTLGWCTKPDTPKYITTTKIVEVPVASEPQKIWVPFEPEYYEYEVTAYTAGFESTGKRPGDRGYGITASGEQVVDMWTIACPPEIPFGTRIYIAEVQWVYSCQDRGSAITSGHLDIYMSDLDHALQFGRRKLHIFILPKSKEESQWNLIYTVRPPQGKPAY